MEISQFNPAQIDEVARMAASVWGKEQGVHGVEVARVFCGHSLYSPELALQAVDEDVLQAIAFAWMPGDTNDADVWVRSQFATLSEEERNTLLTNENYLKRIDAEILREMVPNSAKLSFFISRKKGYGTPVLNALIELLRQRGVEWLYLWTDCACNWQYYVNHGYEKIGEGVAPEFSTDKEDYTYYMFRKRIL